MDENEQKFLKLLIDYDVSIEQFLTLDKAWNELRYMERMNILQGDNPYNKK